MKKCQKSVPSQPASWPVGENGIWSGVILKEFGKNLFTDTIEHEAKRSNQRKKNQVLSRKKTVGWKKKIHSFSCIS